LVGLGHFRPGACHQERRMGQHPAEKQ